MNLSFPRLVPFFVVLTFSLLGSAHALEKAHPVTASLLSNASKVEEVRSRLSSSWKIVGMDTRTLFVESNFAGRLINGAGKSCSTSFVWDDPTPAKHVIWPIVLTDIGPSAIRNYLVRAWESFHAQAPDTLSDVADKISAQIAKRGYATASVSREGGAIVNLVFIAGSKITAENDRAVFDYAIISTVAGFSGDDGAPVDKAYSMLSAWGQDMDLLAGYNDLRFQAVCRAFGVVSALCSGQLSDLPLEKIQEFLANLEDGCLPGKGIVEALIRAQSAIEHGVEN